MEVLVFIADKKVATEDGSITLFDTHEIDSDIVVYNVVTMLNENKGIMDIDAYLLGEDRCTQDEREIMVEGIARALAIGE